MSNISSKLPAIFFEKIQLHPLDNKAGKFNVQSDKHFIFSMEHKFRGIKKALKGKEHPFFFTHEESFNTACAIFKELYKKNPTSVYYFHDPDKTWNAFAVTHEDLPEETYTSSEFRSKVPVVKPKYNTLMVHLMAMGWMITRHFICLFLPLSMRMIHLF